MNKDGTKQSTVPSTELGSESEGGENSARTLPHRP